MIRLLCLFFATATLFGEGRANAATLEIPRAGPKHVVVVPAPPAQPEPIAKLPPPVAPGMEINGVASVVVTQKTLPSGVEIEEATPVALATNKVMAVIEAAPAAKKIESPEDVRKARMVADRARVNRNALQWQRERAEAGSEAAMGSLGFRYLKGDGVPKDEGKAREWLEKAAKLGNSAAIRELGRMDAAKAVKE